MLKRIQMGHIGIVKCKRHAKEVMFWPNMHGQTERHGLKLSNLLGVFTDLLVVDYHSRYFDLERMPSTTSSAMINKMKAIFARFGIPGKLVSDNGPQFAAEHFTRFAYEWNFQHVTTSPIYPQTNGLVERSVQTAKPLAPGLFPQSPQEYRNTPIDGLSSPAQFFVSRRLLALLLTTRDQLKPEIVNPKMANERRSLKQASQRYYYNKGTKQLQPLETRDLVYNQTKSRTWKPATVLQKENTPRSYTVRTNDGGQYRWKRRFLLKANNKSLQKPDSSSDQEPCSLARGSATVTA